MWKVVGRVLWAICCASFVLLVPSSASWAATVRPPGSASFSLSAGSSFSSVGLAGEDPEPSPSPGPSGSAAPDPEPEPPQPTVTVTVTSEPEPAPTVTVTAEPEPEPESTLGTTQDEPMIVELSVDQMSVFLLGVCIMALLLGALTVMGFTKRGD